MIKTLLKSVREYKIYAILAPIFIAGEVIVECFIPYVTVKFVSILNAVPEGQKPDMDIILKFGMTLVLMAMLSLAFGALSGRMAAIASCGFAKNLRHDLYYSIQKFSFSNIDKFSTSGLVTRLTTDVANVQMSFMMIIRTAVRCPLMLIVGLAMAIITSPKMSVMFAVVIPILAIGLFQQGQ